MSALREAAQQALEALNSIDVGYRSPSGDPLEVSFDEVKCEAAITALRAALAQEQAEPVQESVATTQQPVIEKPPSDYRRGYWDGFAIGKREGRIEAEDAALKAQEQAEPVAWMQPKTVSGHLRPDLGYESCSSADYGAFPVYRAPPKAEPAQEPVAWVEHEWSGTGSRKLHFEKRDPTVRDEVVNPVWTPLYTDPPKRQPLSGLEAERLLEQVIGSLPAARNLVRAVERAHGIIEHRIEEDSHQTLDAAMQQPRAMAQAYESGYKAGVANEREACAKVCESRFMGDLTREDMEARRCAAAIRERNNP